MRLRQTLRLIVLLWVSAGPALAEEPRLYKKMEWGSVSAFNPLSFYLNGAFDTAQNPFYFSQERFFSNHSRLWERLRNPRFVGEEFYGTRSIPNWTLHLIGGGYDFRYLAEWYQARRVPAPYVLAFLTSYLANIGNEALETTGTKVPPTDHVADLFFFDLVGKILFLNDDVARFFHDTLQMRPWHYQPVLSLNDLRIQNAGLNYIFRPRVFGDDWRPFVHVGLLILGGVSKRISSTDSVSLGLGMVPTDPLEFKGDFVAGVYWDREDSLLGSITFNGTTNLAVRLNVYPGLVRVNDWDVGLYLGYAKSGQAQFGFSVASPIGFGANF